MGSIDRREFLRRATIEVATIGTVGAALVVGRSCAPDPAFADDGYGTSFMEQAVPAQRAVNRARSRRLFDWLRTLVEYPRRRWTGIGR